MTVKELIDSGTPREKYHYLDGIWWDVEGLLAHLLPKCEEATAIYSAFQSLRYRFHDLFSAEEQKQTKKAN